LTLPIKNEFGTGVLNSSVEMAIENYIKPEILEGDNQYFCEKCDSKQDAKRGINLLKGPEILSIVLNRFTLDYSTFQRVKVTDRVTFPHLINLNNYLKGYENITGKQYDKEVERMQLYQKDKV
jgi:ubiquitin carboxyl-terminal hydrolase 47